MKETYLVVALILQFYGYVNVALLQWIILGTRDNETTLPGVYNNVNPESSSLTQGFISTAVNSHCFGGSTWFDTGDANHNTLSNAIKENNYIQFVTGPATVSINGDNTNTVPGAGSTPCITDEAGTYAGWVRSGAVISAAQACTGDGILFTGNGQYLVTPAISNPNKLNFTTRRSGTADTWSMKVQVSTSATGPWMDVATINTILDICTAVQEIDLSAYLGTYFVRFLDTRPGSASTQRGIDDIQISCNISCTASTTVTSFVPLSGPAGTLVTITGAGFNTTPASGGVKFGNVAATSYTIVNSTTIVAEVPSGGQASGGLSVSNGSCFSVPFGTFNTIASTGACTVLMTDLIISEVYDPLNGNDHYIEIYNGTPNPVNLDGPDYQLEIFNDPSVTTTIDINGTIPAGQCRLYYAGSNGGLATGNQLTDGAAFNGNDEVRLLKNGTVIDRIRTPDDEGYSWLRKNTVTGPNAVYTVDEWITSTIESTANLGQFSAMPVLGFTTQPEDQTCSFSMSIAATGNPTAYQWKYFNPVTGTWDNVTLAAVAPANMSGATSPTLNITGDIARLLNYQFYCEIRTSSPTCTTASNAAQFLYNTYPMYRSNVVSGNWTVPANWLMSTDGINFAPTCTYPSALNSSQVIIQNGNKIILNTNLDIDKLTVNTTGELEISTSSSLTILNGQAGADLVVNGTLYDRGSSGNGVSYEDNTGTGNDAGWSLGVSGTLIKTNTGSVANYRDFYETGIANIPATASWIYRRNGDGNPSVASAGMYYPNLSFENTTALPFSFNSASMALSGGTAAASVCTVKGNCLVGLSGTASLTIFNNNISTIPMQINGDLLIGSGSVFTNLSYDGETDSNHGNGTGFEVKGDLTINGTLTANVANTGHLKLSGSSNQNVTGTGIANLQDVTIANTSSTILMNKSIDIPGVLTFASNSALSLQTGYITLVSTAGATARVAPVGTGTTITYGAARFVVERFYPARRAWRLITAPITADPGRSVYNSWQKGGASSVGDGTFVTGELAPAGGLDTSPRMNSSLKLYEGNTWVGVPNTITQLLSGTAGSGTIPDNYGMFLFVRGDRSTTSLFYPPFMNATTLRDTGKIQINTKIFSISDPAPGYSLIGNPYASQVDMNKVMAASTNINKANYTMYDPYLNADQGGYTYFTLSGGVYVQVPDNPTWGQTADLQSSQAFFVQRTGSPAIVRFTEAFKSSTDVSAQFRPQPAGNPATLRANLYIVNPDNSAVLADGVMAGFDESYSNTVDYSDATKFTNTRENLGLLRNNKALAYESRSLVKADDTLFLKLTQTNSQHYRFRFEPANMDPLLMAYLEDDYTGAKTIINLNASDTYDFTITADAQSSATGRFRIVFKKTGDQPLPILFSTVEARALQKNILVEWVVENELNILSYDVEKSADGVNFTAVNTIIARGNTSNTTYNWLDANPGAGNHFYRVRCLDKNGEVQYSDIVKVNVGRQKAGIAVFSNPIIGNEIGLQFTNMPAGKYQASLFNSLGKLMLRKTFNNNGGTANYNIRPTYTIAKGIYQLEIIYPDQTKTTLRVIK